MNRHLLSFLCGMLALQLATAQRPEIPDSGSGALIMSWESQSWSPVRTLPCFPRLQVSVQYRGFEPSGIGQAQMTSERQVWLVRVTNAYGRPVFADYEVRENPRPKAPIKRWGRLRLEADGKKATTTIQVRMESTTGLYLIIRKVRFDAESKRGPFATCAD